MMKELHKQTIIGVIGAGTMGQGIAQVAATYGHIVLLCDNNNNALTNARQNLTRIINRLLEKGRLDEETVNSVLARIRFTQELKQLSGCGLVIEAIVENPEIKKGVFKQLEDITGNDCILATNTSSLSIAAIGSAIQNPQRLLGAHFFNPAPLMPLVEIIPGMTTQNEIVNATRTLITEWGKTTVLAKDTPGFIVNRIARPFYGESLRILEEGFADAVTIDWAMKEIGGFRMGPFELMDFIGNDINYKVTESVFEAFYYDPRYKPSFIQKRMVEAGYWGRKSGKGYYDYSPNAINPAPQTDRERGVEIFIRILAMLINEAIEALFLKIATKEDLDFAMTRGLNYPRGLLKWADEMGLSKVLTVLSNLQEEYGEDRYRPSPLLKRMARNGQTFFGSGN